MAPRKKKSTAGSTPLDPCADALDKASGEPASASSTPTDQTVPSPAEATGAGKPIKRATGGRGKKKSGNRSIAVYEKMVGAMLSAYVLDAIGRLSPRRRELVELMSQEDPDWPFVIESAYGINRTLIRSVYALWTEHFSPSEAVLFVLRGLDCPGGKALEELVMEEFGP